MRRYVIKFTLPNGKSHYGVSDYVRFETYEQANVWAAYSGEQAPEVRHTIEEVDLPEEIAKVKSGFQEEAERLLKEIQKTRGGKNGKFEILRRRSHHVRVSRGEPDGVEAYESTRNAARLHNAFDAGRPQRRPLRKGGGRCGGYGRVRVAGTRAA